MGGAILPVFVGGIFNSAGGLVDGDLVVVVEEMLLELEVGGTSGDAGTDDGNVHKEDVYSTCMYRLGRQRVEENNGGEGYTKWLIQSWIDQVT